MSLFRWPDCFETGVRTWSSNGLRRGASSSEEGLFPTRTRCRSRTSSSTPTTARAPRTRSTAATSPARYSCARFCAPAPASRFPHVLVRIHSLQIEFQILLSEDTFLRVQPRALLAKSERRAQPAARNRRRLCVSDCAIFALFDFRHTWTMCTVLVIGIVF